MRKVEVVEHSNDWKKQFEEEAKLIRSIFTSEIVAIHHIGSTAVAGLAAKPIIDILAEVRDIEKVHTYNDRMITLGYVPKGENGLPGRRYFQKGGDKRTHHVHIYEAGDDEIERHLVFRDYLREHPQAIKEYGTLKVELAKQYPYDISAYIDGKDSFVSEMEQKAIRWYESLEKKE